jgi:hypothetical protein
MQALSKLATRQMGMVALALLVALASTLACASGACRRDDYRGVGCRAAAARETLTFGLSREAAIDVIGRSEVEPPWKNDFGLGPAMISNPFDSETMPSPIGEAYEVVRFFVEASGNPDCPFVQGELRLQPLIFVDDKLVGWKWSYLADVLGQRLSAKATRWNFGAFCDGRRASPSDAEPDNVESENAESENVEPDEAEPDNAEPDNAEPDDAEPDKAEPSETKPSESASHNADLPAVD